LSYERPVCPFISSVLAQALFPRTPVGMQMTHLSAGV